jgi:hypothetical protein
MSVIPTTPVPENVMRAALYTLYRAMVYCRNYSADSKAPQDVVYDLMDALHEIPEILRRWGIHDNNVDKLKLYLGCFNHERWKERSEHFSPPDMVRIFEEELHSQE